MRCITIESNFINLYLRDAGMDHGGNLDIKLIGFFDVNFFLLLGDIAVTYYKDGTKYIVA